jgi:hypothetical protein
VDNSSDCVNRLNTAGIYTATLSVASTDASNGPLLLPLQLVVSGFPDLMDYEGLAGFQEIGIFRPASPAFFVLDQNRTYNYAPNGTIASFGLPGDIPVAGYWTGTAVVSIGVFRCPAGATVCQWYIDLNNNGTWDGIEGGDAIWNFGLPGDIPVVGDWTGYGVSEIGVFRCPTPPAAGVCTWVLDAGNKHYYDPTTAKIATYGLPGDKPVASNWGGGPVCQVGVFRGNGLWIVDNLSFGAWSPNDATYSYGLAGDYPVVGNWYGDLPGVASLRIGVFHPSTGQWILNQSGSNSWLPTDPWEASGSREICRLSVSGRFSRRLLNPCDRFEPAPPAARTRSDAARSVGSEIVGRRRAPGPNGAGRRSGRNACRRFPSSP